MLRRLNQEKDEMDGICSIHRGRKKKQILAGKMSEKGM
jgi:hypothetical protein